ncbi:MAG: asparagine synthase (glutamine-hydrolyzing) [Planctomycetes bacterium]|nr:asparagine synthase (glutamine-hydrolyzing) [Planctomycetota bacterium]
MGAAALMCGIAGAFALTRARALPPDLVPRMIRRLAHRGPDGEGVLTRPGYALAQRRLAIVDIAGGAQPMGLADGTVQVTFNGEIYNYQELRAELQQRGAVFTTNSDTEVLLHGWRAWGTGLAARLRGMFAFALVDETRHCLYAARDHLGKKPFHWLQQDGVFLFASELKALHEARFPRRLRTDAIAQFLALRYVPDPISVFAEVHKLPPAHWALVDADGVRLMRYWQVSFLASDERPAGDWHEPILALLDEATRIRLMGEVPLAPFLSGGIDSYAVVDSMTRTLGRGIAACTIGFDDPAFDERSAARVAAAACGATLREEVLRQQDLLDLDWLADTFDEPFADSSAVPTFHVCRLARRHVTVALSGDGGDESFAGYRRYLFDVREHRVRRLLPAPMWRGLGALYPKFDWLPRPLRWKRTLQNLGLPGDLAYARSVSANLPEDVFAILRREHHAAAGDPLAPVRDAWQRSDARDPLGRAAAADFATWLPGDILVKVDRTSMAVALEVRAPFLDVKMVELAARIPSRHKLAGGQTKAMLRAALRSRLDPAALARRKQGFSVPLRSWLRGPVGDLLAAQLRDPLLLEWIDPAVVTPRLQAHRAGVQDHGELLWAVLMLGRFLRRWCA